MNKIEGRFKPTMLGRMLVEKLLSPALRRHPRRRYTRELEEDLDKIEQGTTDYESTLSSFYKKFQKDLKRAGKEMLNLKEGVEPDPAVTCDKCGKPMVIKAGKFGLFLACSGYPDARTRASSRRRRPAPKADDRGGLRELRQADGRSSAAASASSSPAPAIPSARRRGRSSRPSRGMTAAKPDQILDEKCPKCELEPGREAGPLRRVHRLHATIRPASTSSRRPRA